MFDTAEMAGDGGGDRDRLVRAVAGLDRVGLAVVADLVDVLAGDARSRSAGELTDAMRSLDRVHAVVDSATLTTWSAWEDTMAFTDDGYKAPGSWINANLCVRAGVARYQVGLARKLHAGFPHVNLAASSGRLGRAKVELLVKARAEDIADEFDTDEEALVEEVAVRTVEAADAYLATWRLEVLERLRQNDTDRPPPPEPEGSELQLSPILDDRIMMRGELSGPDGALLTKAINDRIDQWFTAGLLNNDTRSRRQLQADALIELVKDGTAPANRANGARPLTIALIDADTLTARATATHQGWLQQFMATTGITWPDDPTHPSPPPSTGRTRNRGDRNRRARRGRRPSGPNRTRPPDPPPDLFNTSPNTDPTCTEGRGPDRHASDPGCPHPDDTATILGELRDHLADLNRFAATSPTAQHMTFRSEITGAGPTDPTLIEELICTGDLIPMLHRNHTEILDMGRTVRLATPAQRKALLVRSAGTCEWPGCTIPHNWCDAHHLHHWEHQGPTDLANLALVCNHHHKRFHRAHYTGLITPTGLEVLRPDGTPIQPTLSGRL